MFCFSVFFFFSFDHLRVTAPSTSTGMALRGLKQGQWKGYTQMYAAPEYSSESRIIDKKVDVYAFGMVGAHAMCSCNISSLRFD